VCHLFIQCDILCADSGQSEDGKAQVSPVRSKKNHSVEGFQSFLCITNVE